MANTLIDRLRRRIPYIRRLHRRIDELQHQLASAQAAPELHAVEGSGFPEIVAAFAEFLRLLQPHDVKGPSKRRFGADHDGGYVMLDDLARSRTALSLGIGPDVSWDTDVAARGLRVIQFDHTVDGPPRGHSQFVFHRARVVGRRQAAGDVTLTDILSRPDLAGEQDCVVKIDIEGSEWDLLAQTGAASLARIRQLAVEFHNVRYFIEPPWRAAALAALRNLTSAHACIHVHGNNWAPFTVIGGIPFPNAFEASFVRRDAYTLAPSTTVFPTALDRPCNPKMPDLYLGRWSY